MSEQAGEFQWIDNSGLGSVGHSPQATDRKSMSFREFCGEFHRFRDVIGKPWRKEPSANRCQPIIEESIRQGWVTEVTSIDGPSWYVDVEGGLATLLSMVSPNAPLTFSPLQEGLTMDERMRLYTHMLEWSKTVFHDQKVPAGFRQANRLWFLKRK